MYEIGMETNVTLSDLMTIVTSYDTTKKLTSNGIGAYYHSIGGHKHANQFIHEILGASSMETFGGNYGEPVPVTLEYTFTNTLQSLPSSSNHSKDIRSNTNTTIIKYNEFYYNGRMVTTYYIFQRR